MRECRKHNLMRRDHSYHKQSIFPIDREAGGKMRQAELNQSRRQDEQVKEMQDGRDEQHRRCGHSDASKHWYLLS